MSSSRDKILNTLRQARSPFMDAEPRPADYQPVTSIDDTSPDGLLARFKEEMERLNGEVFEVKGDDAARACVLDLLKSHNTKRVMSWQFKHIPVEKLYTAIQEAGYTIDYPNIHHDNDEDREAEITRLETAEVGLTSADAVAATTGTLIVSTAQGKGRLPTVLPPVHIAVVPLDRFEARIEDWLAKMRQTPDSLTSTSNICFISGPSRTADIEKKLVLGVHGPTRVQVVVKR